MAEMCDQPGLASLVVMCGITWHTKWCNLQLEGHVLLASMQLCVQAWAVPTTDAACRSDPAGLLVAQSGRQQWFTDSSVRKAAKAACCGIRLLTT
eukprot:364325-Chlamydomonas_euryale.AAC.8